MTTPRAGLEIVNKADAVVRALEQFGELTVVRVAEIVGEPVSSTYRLLKSLMRIGWVDRGSSRGLYRLGMFFLRIGGLVEDRVDVRERAMPFLQALRSETGATSYLCIRRGTSAVCVERLEGEGVRSMALRLGDSLRLDVGAAPLVLLSYLPSGERDAVIDELAREAAVRDSPFWRESVMARIDEVRMHGYAVSDGDVTPGVAAVGAPVFNHRGELEAAMSASGLRAQLLGSADRTAEVVVAAARAASDAMGFHAQGAER